MGYELLVSIHGLRGRRAPRHWQVRLISCLQSEGWNDLIPPLQEHFLALFSQHTTMGNCFRAVTRPLNRRVDMAIFISQFPKINNMRM